MLLGIFEEQNFFSLSAGEWLILRRGRRHGGINEYPPDLSFFWIHFIDEAGTLEQLPQHGRAARPERLTSYCQCFLAEQQEPEPDAETRKLLFALIFREIQHQSNPVVNPVAATSLAVAAERLIRLRFADPLTPASLARELKCNSNYLGKLYCSRYGESISAAINRLRVEFAARLLAEQTDSIKEIMQKAGFNDPAYFRRRFKCRYAVTPGQFRKLWSSGHWNTE